MKNLIATLIFCLSIFLTGTTALGQRSAEEHLKRSQALETEDLDRAIAELDKAIAIKPDFAAAYAQESLKPECLMVGTMS